MSIMIKESCYWTSTDYDYVLGIVSIYSEGARVGDFYGIRGFLKEFDTNGMRCEI